MLCGQRFSLITFGREDQWASEAVRGGDMTPTTCVACAALEAR